MPFRAAVVAVPFLRDLFVDITCRLPLKK